MKMPNDNKVKRLDKLIADAGLGTRKSIRNMIVSGRVTVDGIVEKDPGRRLPTGRHVIEVDSKPIRQHLLTLMLYKPRGVVTATSDSEHQTVIDLLPEGISRHLVPAGRLDKDSEGLVILTEDGVLCHQIISPKHGVEKQYEVTATGRPPTDIVHRFEQGIRLADGTLTLPARIESITEGSSNAVPSDTGTMSALVTITEGKYHQVRRMLAACGLHVTRLKRIRIGQLILDPALSPGQFRELKPSEIGALLINP